MARTLPSASTVLAVQSDWSDPELSQQCFVPLTEALLITSLQAHGATLSNSRPLSDHRSCSQMAGRRTEWRPAAVRATWTLIAHVAAQRQRHACIQCAYVRPQATACSPSRSHADTLSTWLQCRACRPCARRQRQGDAVPAGGAVCKPQHQVPADPQGLQGMLRARGPPVMLHPVATLIIAISAGAAVRYL